MRTPDARYVRVKELVSEGKLPSDDIEAALYRHLTEKGVRNDAGDAYDIYMESEHRAVLEAFLIAGSTSSLIEKVLQIPSSTTAAYQHLFFDQSSFRNRLELLGYATEFDGSNHAREVLRASVTVGLEYLLWVYGGANVQVDSRQVIRHTMAEAYYRGMAHRGNSITSGVAKESQKWWATAVRNAELLEKIDPRAEKQAFEEIRIQLEKHDDTFTPDDAPVDPADIMH